MTHCSMKKKLTVMGCVIGFVLALQTSLYGEIGRLKTNYVADLLAIPNLTAEFKVTEHFWMAGSFTSLNWGGGDNDIFDYNYQKWTLMPRYHHKLNTNSEYVLGLGIGHMTSKANSEESQSQAVIEFFGGFDFLMSKQFLLGFGFGVMYVLDPNNEEGEDSSSVDAVIPIIDAHVGWRF